MLSVLRGEGCDALGHTLELITLMNEASTVLRSLLLSPAAQPIVSELEATRARGAEEAQKKRTADTSLESSPADGAEKASEMLQRAAFGLKHLSQALRAPGKRD